MATPVSVVTLTHNKLACTRMCLGSLLKTSDCPWELVVVDNGSDDGTREWLEGFRGTAAAAGVDVRLVLNDGNIGCSTARNQGFAESSGEYVVFMDNDVALRSGKWLSGMRKIMDDDATIAIVGPKLVYPQPPYDIQCAGVAISKTGRPKFLGRGDNRDDPRFNEFLDMQCLTSACFMVRRSVMDDVGGFDEAFNPVEYEDFDLCYRARSNGNRVVYLPSVEMYHFENVTTCGTPRLPNTYLIIKHGLLFKKRWRHMFETEGGPPDSETKWRAIEPCRIEDVHTLPIID
ncbi:MAG: glycosyltransferase family 2 protein [Kiritimatiellia bacterium]|jgi:GT2 family glycosyltransferase|nr:glycosyltransferase family 2 protein [Kiritimatiellia bacterium]